jgi:hypothetical protein
MAAKKKSKKPKAVKKAKATRRTAKKPAKKKAAKKVAKKAAPRKAAKKPVKAGASARAGATKNKQKAPARKKKQIVGEGDYAATRAFDRDQASFVNKNKAKIPALGREAEKALEGPEGEALRAAEAAGLARSRDMF